jgi:23S rRNA (cytidine1920-2'-O)/16S rRNA (cytidine1409-2'-O)-methyltransferase
MPLPSRPVSRAYHKLAAALDGFRLSPAGWVAADFGCNVGGFTQCLLARGADRVYALDTSTKLLDYSLRRDPRVVVMEGVNALHASPPEPVDLVVIDVGWTRQILILPAARSWLKPDGRVITLVKPHYEADRALLKRGRLPDERVKEVVAGVLQNVANLGWQVLDRMDSPIRGGAGNQEILVLLKTRNAEC